MAFDQSERLVVHRLDVAEAGAINFGVASSSSIVLSPIPVSISPSGGGTGVTADAGAFLGRYTLIGNLCYFSYQADLTKITNFGTGQYFMTLPFPTAKPFLTRQGCLHDVSANIQYHITGHAIAGSTQMDLFTTDSAGNRHYDFQFKQGTPITLTSADTFHIEGIYEADLQGA